MMSSRLITTILLSTTLLGSAAYATDQAAKPAISAKTDDDPVRAEKAVGKLSTDGMAAFRDIHMARLAIFDADPKEAISLIQQAQAALQKAKTDKTAYHKAESAMMALPNEKEDAAKVADMNAQPVAWLPIDGQLTIAEDFTASPEKQEALKKANDSVHKGDQKGALETLKIADVDVGFAMAVLPLDKTIQDVEQAATLIKDGKYYEANAVLKRTEESVHFDTVDLVGILMPAATPQKTEPAASPAK